MKPLSKDEISQLVDHLDDRIPSNFPADEIYRFAHTALMAHKFKEALEKISDYFISNHQGRFGQFIGAGAVDVAKEALALWEKE